ncbi:MAG TPA: c-type cytochrome [Terriglobales bacterium]|nr:c-type cytochrome [Terriglobales bacterium]
MKLSVLLAVLAVVAASAGGQNTQSKTDPKWVAPADAAAKQNPLAGNAEAVAGGKKLFLRSCAECHGEDGAGIEDAANLQTPEVQKQTDGTLFWKITNGNVKKGMPPFARLPETQRWQIISFMRTLKPAKEASPPGANPPSSPKGR